MSHRHRFFVPSFDDAEIQLPPLEAHHAVRVVRLRTGDRVALFDGQGREVIATVTHIDRRDVILKVEERREPRPMRHRLTVCMGWLKRDKSIEFAIRHGVELGVTAFVFFRAAHSERAPQPDEAWQRLAVESCKQCGRLWLPSFAAYPSLDEALEATQGPRWIATKSRPAVPIACAAASTENAVFIGPEGDFTDVETDAILETGAKAMSLGSFTFRSEVAAIVASTLLLYEMGAFGENAGATRLGTPETMRYTGAEEHAHGSERDPTTAH